MPGYKAYVHQLQLPVRIELGYQTRDQVMRCSLVGATVGRSKLRRREWTSHLLELECRQRRDTKYRYLGPGIWPRLGVDGAISAPEPAGSRQWKIPYLF